MHHSFETRIDYIALQEIVIEIDARKRDYQAFGEIDFKLCGRESKTKTRDHQYWLALNVLGYPSVFITSYN